MNGVVVWITGLPAAGKSTLAERARDRIGSQRACVILDSDAMRDALGRHSYSSSDRDELYATLARLAAMIARQGVIVIVAATAPLRAHRERARELAPRFIEVFVSTPREIAEQRDPKGLYRAARAGDAPTLPGMGAPYEVPERPDIVAADGRDDDAALAIARSALRPSRADER